MRSERDDGFARGNGVFRDIGIIDDTDIALRTGFHDVEFLLFAQ